MEQKTATEKLGHCYESAFTTIVDSADTRLTLVHGRPTLTRAPFAKFGHAWIEIGSDFVFDTECKKFVLKTTYYQVGKIDPAECFHYSRRAAIEWSQRTGHYGPWEGIESNF